jgi:hypothetical protein
MPPLASKRGLADRPEVVLVHVAQEAVFQVHVTEAPGIIVPQHTLDVRGRQHLTHDIKDVVVVPAWTARPLLCLIWSEVRSSPVGCRAL